MIREVLSATDDARLIVGGKSHRLGAVKFWVLESRQANKPVSQGGRQIISGYV